MAARCRCTWTASWWEDWPWPTSLTKRRTPARGRRWRDFRTGCVEPREAASLDLLRPARPGLVDRQLQRRHIRPGDHRVADEESRSAFDGQGLSQGVGVGQ